MDSSLYVQCLAALLRLPVHQTLNSFMDLKESFADETNQIIFGPDVDWKSFIKSHLTDHQKLRHILNLLYPLLLRGDSFPKEAVKEIVKNITLLIEIMAGKQF